MIFAKLPCLYSVDEFPWPNPYEEKWKSTLNSLDINSLYPNAIVIHKLTQPARL